MENLWNDKRANKSNKSDAQVARDPEKMDQHSPCPVLPIVVTQTPVWTVRHWHCAASRAVRIDEKLLPQHFDPIDSTPGTMSTMVMRDSLMVRHSKWQRNNKL